MCPEAAIPAPVRHVAWVKHEAEADYLYLGGALPILSSSSPIQHNSIIFKVEVMKNGL
jgi:hypothetical protein